MADPSNPPPHVSPGIQELYLHALNANVSNFVSVKLSTNDNYHLWKTQMLCLMETHDMCRLVNGPVDRSSSTKIMKQYDSLLKGWIFGSISQEVFGTVVNLDSAKQVWDKLKSFYAPNISFQQETKTNEETEGNGISTETETNEETSGNDISAETETKEETEGNDISIETETNEETEGNGIETETKEETEVNGISTETQEENEGNDISRETKTKEQTEGNSILAETETETETETKSKDVVSKETETKEDHITISVEPGDRRKARKLMLPSFSKRKPEGIEEEWKRHNKDLEEAAMKGNWNDVRYLVKRYGFSLKLEAINNEKSTIFHLAVEKGLNLIVIYLLEYLAKEEVQKGLEMKNVDGSTALHVAAIVGNKRAAKLLVEKHNRLLEILDNQDNDPLSKAYSNLHFDTCIYLLKKLKAKQDNKLSDHLIKIGVDLVVNAISAKQYCTASKFVDKFPEFATGSDEVLMAIARTFPSGLSHEETCPDLGDIGIGIIRCIASRFYDWVVYWYIYGYYYSINIWDVPKMLLCWVFQLIFSLILFVFLPFAMPYFLVWKGATKLGSYMKRTKKKEWEEAKEVLKLVCNKIDTLAISGTHHPHYEGPILEAACQNTYEVVNEILSRSRAVIRCKDKCGYDIIQLAVIHRSDKIYNRVYQNGEGNNQYYKTVKDCSQNNMLHLAGRLAPSCKLNRITGAALQLQRELQWREELKKFVFPAYITQENIYKETPDVVFTREHENLVKEGEKWMKTTAESCSITAGLITTIVFAAAITVPGGSNQEKGIPLFTHEIAFIIFAISDAISLFTSTITLLVFLSILTTRFSEQDFLVSLPRQLIIGLCALLVSTTAMMVAFGAVLFLVFCHKKPWMLVPICASVCLTIGFFFVIQFPLIVDLYRSTYITIFGKKSNSHEDSFMNFINFIT